jgi:hypothetical protein
MGYKGIKQRIVDWLLKGVHLRGFTVGDESISMSPGGVDVVRWSVTQNPVAAGDVGMSTVTGRPIAFVGGVAEPLAVSADLGGAGFGVAPFMATGNSTDRPLVAPFFLSWYATATWFGPDTAAFGHTATLGVPDALIPGPAGRSEWLPGGTAITVKGFSIGWSNTAGAGTTSVWLFKNFAPISGPHLIAVTGAGTFVVSTFTGLAIPYAPGDVLQVCGGQDVGGAGYIREAKIYVYFE